MRAARLVWLAALALLMAAPARAQSDGLPTEPMLRINAPSYIAMIRRIATDAAERFAVTASEDKTVRVWSLPDGTLQRVIWLPSGEGHLGKADAVALSPDGVTVAVGGWTDPTGGDTNIYLFNRASGALVRRLTGLPNVIYHLAFSPDGRRLAAALWGARGVRVFDVTNGYRQLPSDADYSGDSYWVDFDRDGRLISASLDGFVQLYAADRYDRPAVPRTSVRGIRRPFSVAFSPDGRHVAVGDYDSATVAVLRDRDLQPEIFPTVTGLDATGLNVAWSQDGGQLFAEGYHLGHLDRLPGAGTRRAPAILSTSLAGAIRLCNSFPSRSSGCCSRTRVALAYSMQVVMPVGCKIWAAASVPLPPYGSAMMRARFRSLMIPPVTCCALSSPVAPSPPTLPRRRHWPPRSPAPPASSSLTGRPTPPRN